MVDYFTMFNTKLIELLDDLSMSLPNGRDFTTYKSLLSGLMAVDKNAPQTLFNTTVAIPYGKYIDACDEAFFLNEDYTRAGVEQGLIEQLKGVWRSLDKENKEAIWKYMRVLLKLNSLCMNA